jgi:hypothetical protein
MPFDPLDIKLQEIETRLRNLTPEERARILDWVNGNKQRNANIQKAVEVLQTTMDTLRVLIKYTTFDLEATRRENLELRTQIAQLQQILEDKGYYDDEGEGVQMFGDCCDNPLPEAVDGLIDLPDLGDFIHNDNCDHPFNYDCPCYHCKECRDRYRDMHEGAD